MKSPIGWVGGKSRVVHKLLPIIPEHVCYAEVFGGAGWLLFAKAPSRVEILNDLDGNLMNFWSVVKNAPDQLIESFNYNLISRETFDTCRLKFINGEYEDSIERAHIFYYILKTCFGCKMTELSFGITKTRSLAFNVDRIEKDINAAYERLKHVTIESLDFRKVMKHYDSADTLFFLDPPYLDTMGYAVGDFGINDYYDLHAIINQISGKFILTVNDHPDLRNMFKDFNFIEHDVLYSMMSNKAKQRKFGELIITNYT
ncbi:MAG: DNA adenine methylase [Anaerofustis sp.]